MKKKWKKSSVTLALATLARLSTEEVDHGGLVVSARREQDAVRDKMNNWKRLALALDRLLSAATRGGVDPGGAALEARAARMKLKELGEDKA